MLKDMADAPAKRSKSVQETAERQAGQPLGVGWVLCSYQGCGKWGRPSTGRPVDDGGVWFCRRRCAQQHGDGGGKGRGEEERGGEREEEEEEEKEGGGERLVGERGGKRRKVNVKVEDTGSSTASEFKTEASGTSELDSI